jgi:hypothetical protein
MEQKDINGDKQAGINEAAYLYLHTEYGQFEID